MFELHVQIVFRLVGATCFFFFFLIYLSLTASAVKIWSVKNPDLIGLVPKCFVFVEYAWNEIPCSRIKKCV